MAEFNSLTFGTISGRHGSAVATTTKKNGKCFLRVYRKSVDTKTEKQVAHRTKFSFAMAFLSPMREILDYTFKAKGGYNYGFAHTMKNAIEGTAPNYVVDFSKMIFSEGGVKAIKGATMEKLATDTLKVSWDITQLANQTIGGAKPNEELQLILYHEGEKESMFFEHAAIRSAGTLELSIPTYWQGGTMHSWMYFSRPDGSMNSETVYLTSLEL